MKKLFGFMVMSLVAVMPFTVKAATGIAVNSSQDCKKDDAGNITCTVHYNITDSEENLTVTLTEQGGATVTAINQATGSDWSLVGTPNEVNDVWTVVLASPGTSGEGDLFTFTYKASGTDDCRVVVALGETQVPVTPETPTPSKPDEPTDNKQTGATLPYIALGAVVVIATGAYLATRNKAKMYKI